MNAIPWPLPAKPRLEDLTWTRWSALRQCGLRAAYMADVLGNPWLRTTEAMALGTVRHALADEVSRGVLASGPDGPVEALRQRFDQLAARQHAHMVDQWATTSVPPPRGWARYFHLRATVSRELAARVPDTARRALPGDTGQQRKLVVASGASNPPPPAPGERLTELSLVDSERGLRGRLDVVAALPDGTLEVLDLKSRVAEESDALGLGRDQLIFYAGLVEAAWSTIPTLALVAPDGRRTSVGCVASEIGGLRAEIADYRAALADREVRAMASPAPSTCARCPFTVICPAFRDLVRHREGGEALEWALTSSWGYVTKVTRAASACSLAVSQLEDLSLGAGEVIISGLAHDLAVEPGDSVVVVGGSVQGERAFLRASWKSRVRVAPNLTATGELHCLNGRTPRQELDLGGQVPGVV